MVGYGCRCGLEPPFRVLEGSRTKVLTALVRQFACTRPTRDESPRPFGFEVERCDGCGTAHRVGLGTSHGWQVRVIMVLQTNASLTVEIKTSAMKISQFFSPESISLNLQASDRDGILKELISLLTLDTNSGAGVYDMLKRRENLASTGIGRGVAVPHCRSLHVPRLRAAYAHKPQGVEFRAIDERPVYDFFLIVAPPLEVSNDYLPVLGQIAGLMKDSDMPERLAQLQTPQQFLDLLDEIAV